MEENNKPEVAQEQPQVDDKVEKLKIKKKPSMKKFSNDPDGTVKLDLSKKPKPEENEKPEEPKEEVTESNVDDSGVVAEPENTESVQKQEEVQPEAETQETPVVEEVTEETKQEVVEVAEEAKEAIEESLETGKPLPENIQKLVDFMNETGGDIQDYVKLNQDFSKYDDISVLREYYKQTKPHLTDDEISFVMEDTFSYDEDEHTEKEIRRKKLALKEQVASARSHLDGQKSKYYAEIKAGSKLTLEQQKAVDFFNRYNKNAEQDKLASQKSRKIFSEKTDKVFNQDFKGFEYKIGDKKFRFNVKDPNSVKQQQSDINNFAKKFLGKDNELQDAAGYHKSIFTAMNADAIANHFYEQGKADALKNSIANSKNVDMNPRQSHGQIEAGGMKFKVLGDSSSDFKFKIKNKNK
tara:strand:+ start:727 stop:1956 length:1230 start_codon:yes stop_codon:yes gene_type:complete